MGLLEEIYSLWCCVFHIRSFEACASFRRSRLPTQDQKGQTEESECRFHDYFHLNSKYKMPENLARSFLLANRCPLTESLCLVCRMCRTFFTWWETRPFNFKQQQQRMWPRLPGPAWILKPHVNYRRNSRKNGEREKKSSWKEVLTTTWGSRIRIPLSRCEPCRRSWKFFVLDLNSARFNQSGLSSFVPSE